MPLATHEQMAAAELRPVADALARAGYDQSSRERMEGVLERRGRMDLDAAMTHTSGGAPADTLLRVFALARAEPSKIVARALGAPAVGTLVGLGVLEPAAGDVLRANVSIIPAAGFYTTRDFAAPLTGRPLDPDHVLGIGPSTMALARLTVRRTAGTVLDLGVGQGFQSLLASSHAGRVIGTDVNPRALSCAMLAAGLSGKANIECRLGSFFEPVEASRGGFDLIVSNPPFVIAPPTSVVAFTSGIDGDGCVEHIARAAPAFLRDGGYLCMFCNWHHAATDDWEARPASWVRGSGCDAWVIRLEGYSPRDYATRWTRELAGGGHGGVHEGDAQAIDDWVEHFRRLGIGGITLGAIILRRRPGANWMRSEALPFDYHTGEGGEQIERAFASETALRELSDQALAARRFRMAPASEIDQRLRFVPGRGLLPHKVTLRQTAGFACAIGVEGGLLDVLSRLDGSATLLELATQVAGGGKADPHAVVAQLLPIVKRLLRATHLEMVA